MEYRIISIGTLAHNEFWDPSCPLHTAHATTTLIRSKDHVILVDPGLPPQIISARLQERSGLNPNDVTHVFLTCFRPAHRMGLAAFEHANWLISEMEREVVGKNLIERFEEESDDSVKQIIGQEIALLKRFAPAPDRLADQVDLFPLPGYTPATCGLLLCHTNSTTLVAGDAVATVEHLLHGRVLKGCYDADQARESFTEAVEIADVIIPGHDNLVLNPTRRPM